MLGRANTSVAVLALALGATAEAAEADFASLMRQARSSAAKGDDKAAMKLLREAGRASKEPPEGGPKKAEAAELMAEILLGKEQLLDAEKYLGAASRFALGDHKLRRRLMRARVSALSKAKAPNRRAKVEALMEHDQTVHRYERVSKVDPNSEMLDVRNKLEVAARAYGRDGDWVRALWARAVKVKVWAWSTEKPEVALAAAQKELERRRKSPAMVRAVAFKAAWWAAKRAGRLDLETEYVLGWNALENPQLSDEERAFTRNKWATSACRKYEKENGPGSCALLSHKVSGVWSFFDYSKTAPKSSLSAADIDIANKQYVPAVKDCIEKAVAAYKDTDLFDDTHLKISWIVASTGHTKEVEIKPRRFNEVLGPCVRERIALFRYHRSLDGQSRQVALPYEFYATTRYR